MRDDRELIVSAAALLNSPGLLAYLDAAANLSLSRRRYSMGDYLVELEGSALDELSQVCEKSMHRADARALLTLLAALLMNAEGLALRTAEDATLYLRRLYLLSGAERLRRDGSVAVDYSDVSLSTFPAYPAPAAAVGDTYEGRADLRINRQIDNV